MEKERESDVSCNFVEPGDQTQDAAPKFPVGLSRSFCFFLPPKVKLQFFGEVSDWPSLRCESLRVLQPTDVETPNNHSVSGREHLFSMFEIVDWRPYM